MSTTNNYMEFVELADKDYIATRLLNSCGTTLYFQTAYHAQQCIEKYLKALVLQKGCDIPKEHNLKKLSALCAPLYNNLIDKESTIALRKFDEMEQVSRYGSFAKFDPLAPKLRDTVELKGMFIWADSYLKNLDKLVYRLRKAISFTELPGRDALTAIIRNDIKNQILFGWKLKGISLKEVLTNNNDYFNENMDTKGI